MVPQAMRQGRPGLVVLPPGRPGRGHREAAAEVQIVLAPPPIFLPIQFFWIFLEHLNRSP
jgi:hypothetical protein